MTKKINKYIYYIHMIYIFTIVVLILLNIMSVKVGEFYKIKCSKTSNLHSQHIEDSLLIRDMALNCQLVSENSNFKMPLENFTTEGSRFPFLSDSIYEKKIVLRFNEIGCMTCVFREITNIDSLALKIGYDKILIFASYHSERDLQSFKRINGITCPVYNLPMGALNNEIENYNIPYLFVIDETLSASHLFIPQKGLPTLSKDYFQRVSQLF